MDEYDWEFETFDDPVLIDMLKRIKDYMLELEKGCERFLTFSGPSGIGKTHLLKRAARFINKADFYFKKQGFMSKKVIYESWDAMVPKLLDSSKDYMYDLSHCGIVIVTEFLGYEKANNYTDIQIDLGRKLLDARAEMPMLIETNKSLKDFEVMDQRIASRLKRYGSEFLKFKDTVKPYQVRTKTL